MIFCYGNNLRNEMRQAEALHSLVIISEMDKPMISDSISGILHTNASYIRRILSAL